MTVYLVDDDSEEADLFTEAIGKVDPSISVIWYDDVMEALDALIREKGKPELLFLDLNIPKVSGKDLLRMMRQTSATSTIPVIIYSTSITKKDIADTAPFNVKGYLQKPENFQALCERLREMLAKV